MRPFDTSAGAWAQQLARYRQMTPEARADLAAAMCDDVREIAIAGIRARHPDYDEVAAAAAYARLILGDALYRRAFPQRPVLAP